MRWTAVHLFSILFIYIMDMKFTVDIEFKKGDKRITYTKTHVITEIVSFINGYKDPVWEIESIEKVDNSKDKNTLEEQDGIWYWKIL